MQELEKIEQLANQNTLYIFIDESGDTNFTSKSSKNFLLTGLVCPPSSQLVSKLYHTKHKLIPVFETLKKQIKNRNEELECFHATEDLQIIRDEVFKIIGDEKNLSVYSVIIEKRKTVPFYQDPRRFYTKACIWLMHGVLYNQDIGKYKKIIIFFDSIPADNKKKKAMFKGLKTEIANFFKEMNIQIPYCLCMHQSKSNTYLQIVDYISWAIYIKNERNETRPYAIIQKFIKNEFFPFARGQQFFY